MAFDLDEIMDVATREASKSDCKYKVSCILVDRKGNIVAKGYNHHSVGGKMGKWTVHAEMDAISSGIMKPSRNLIAFIYRRNGRIIHPCEACKALLKAYGITTIYHTNDESWERL